MIVIQDYMIKIYITFSLLSAMGTLIYKFKIINVIVG